MFGQIPFLAQRRPRPGNQNVDPFRSPRFCADLSSDPLNFCVDFLKTTESYRHKKPIKLPGDVSRYVVVLATNCSSKCELTIFAKNKLYDIHFSTDAIRCFIASLTSRRNGPNPSDFSYVRSSIYRARLISICIECRRPVGSPFRLMSSAPL